MNETLSKEMLFVVRVGNSLYAVRAIHVDHVAPMEQPVPVPAAPAHILGVVRTRRQIVAVVDTRSLVGLAAEERRQGDPDVGSELCRLVVMRIDGAPFALMCDEVLGLRDFQPDASIELQENASNDVGRPIAGEMKTEEGYVTVLRARQMLSQLMGA